MQLTLTDITYRYDDAPDPALPPISVTFPSGWTGIVGSNGTGKTTLLRLVCGELIPFNGRIVPRLNGIYCPQETERAPAAAGEFVSDYRAEARAVRRALGIQGDWAERYGTLSEGERKRLQVAVALWQNPDVLALDEPTNHVDAECRERLLEALKSFSGVGLLVSHDREMLDALAGQCLFLGSSAVLRAGSYSHGRAQELADQKAAARQRMHAKSEVARLQQAKAARNQEAAKADARRSKRGIPKGDKSAKGRHRPRHFNGPRR